MLPRKLKKDCSSDADRLIYNKIMWGSFSSQHGNINLRSKIGYIFMSQKLFLTKHWMECVISLRHCQKWKTELNAQLGICSPYGKWKQWQYQFFFTSLLLQICLIGYLDYRPWCKTIYDNIICTWVTYSQPNHLVLLCKYLQLTGCQNIQSISIEMNKLW